jgi:hypothetical protein
VTRLDRTVDFSDLRPLSDCEKGARRISGTGRENFLPVECERSLQAGFFRTQREERIDCLITCCHRRKHLR